MRLTNLLPAIFAASASATTFVGFVDNACQRADGRMIDLSAKELQDIIVKGFPSGTVDTEAHRAWTTPDDRRRCPRNADDTSRWVDIPQWRAGDPSGKPAPGGAVAVTYYKGTDTYSVCSYLPAAQGNGYPGSCNVRRPTPPATPPHE
ncbi:hypothetical protein CFE70_001600 [Pyrenophora teres f. teres 0-1]|uniref:Uncharacterized protein n=2 Tax=Pyrenophora teres f. teres TaxID=97479 RepID=E3S1E6_PYRTT|nr:hypothetical protein PTT_16023 [Pyrenophora teres f. teres 0-1]KAE8842151.1 hypothetical protein HRS9139_01448 [Pyrenophora teres f. teres]CAA9958046.1 hypothetical protein PTMSG1_01620 [Pyrenophora teres f. maculata]KAE8850778.1 hypothetical protein PTNB85_01194 [Pyrenophora teres f. teres]KAE8851189.1 hypothetical protein HRS9122_01476 [Pyrenophora teres f. teres]